jgi:hypothetical protein
MCQLPVTTLKNYLLEIMKMVSSDLSEELKEEDNQDIVVPFGPTMNRHFTKALITKDSKDLNTFLQLDAVDFHSFCLVPPIFVLLFLGIDSHLDAAPKRYWIYADLVPMVNEAKIILADHPESLKAVFAWINYILTWLLHTVHVSLKSMVMHPLNLNESLEYILETLPYEFKEQTFNDFVDSYTEDDVISNLPAQIAPLDMQALPPHLLTVKI